jgi:hypothetical protein
MIEAVNDARVALLAGWPYGANEPMKVLPVGGSGRELLLGLDSDRVSHILVPAEPGATVEYPTLKHIGIRDRELLIEGKLTPCVDLSCSEPEFLEVFDQFAAAVAARIADSAGSKQVALADVLESWRQFFKQATQAVTITNAVGLFGELLLLRELSAVSATAALAAWMGPLGGRHDFRHGSKAVEVKSTKAHTAKRVQIHGADQLEAPENGLLEVLLVRVEEVSGGKESVMRLIETIVSNGIDRVSLYERLEANSVSIVSLPLYEEFAFDIRDIELFHVVDGFPRITAETFSAGVPIGVDDLNYSVDLATVEPAKTGKPALASAAQLILEVS